MCNSNIRAFPWSRRKRTLARSFVTYFISTRPRHHKTLNSLSRHCCRSSTFSGSKTLSSSPLILFLILSVSWVHWFYSSPVIMAEEKLEIVSISCWNFRSNLERAVCCDATFVYVENLANPSPANYLNSETNSTLWTVYKTRFIPFYEGCVL